MTSTTSSCRACSAGSSKRWWAPACRRSWSSSRVAPTRSGGRSTDPRLPPRSLQAFFPGEEGGAAIVRDPLRPHGAVRTASRLAAPRRPERSRTPTCTRFWAGPSEITSADSSPALPFGHGLTYTTFEHTRADGTEPSPTTSDDFTVTVDVANTGARAGVDVVQLYARDLYASVTRPVAQLVGYARVALEAGERTVVQFEVPSARLAFTDRRGVRIVEPGEVELWVGGSCDDQETRATMRLTAAGARGDGGRRPDRLGGGGSDGPRVDEPALTPARTAVASSCPGGRRRYGRGTVTGGLPCRPPPERQPRSRSPCRRRPAITCGCTSPASR